MAKKYLLNSMWMLIDKALSLLSVFVWLMIITRALTLDEMGYYSYYMAIAGLCLPLAAAGLNGIAGRELLSKPEALVVTNVLAIKVGFGLIVYSVAAIAFFWMDSQVLPWLFVGLILLFQGLSIGDTRNQVKSQSIYTASTRILVTLVSLPIKIFLYVKGTINLEIALLIYALEYSVVFIGVYFHSLGLKTFSLSELNFKYMRYLIAGGFFLIASGFAETINLRIDQVMIKEMLGTEQAGLYFLSVRLAELSYFVPTAVAASFYPKLHKLYIDNDLGGYYTYLSRLIKVSMVFSLGIIVFVQLSSAWIFSVFFDEKYSGSETVLNILIVTLPFIFFRAFFSKWLIQTNLLKYSLYTHLFGALSNVLLNFYAIPRFGLIGACYASVVSYSISSFFTLFLFKDTRRFLSNVFINKKAPATSRP